MWKRVGDHDQQRPGHVSDEEGIALLTRSSSKRSKGRRSQAKDPKVSVSKSATNRSSRLNGHFSLSSLSSSSSEDNKEDDDEEMIRTRSGGGGLTRGQMNYNTRLSHDNPNYTVSMSEQENDGSYQLGRSGTLDRGQYSGPGRCVQFVRGVARAACFCCSWLHRMWTGKKELLPRQVPLALPMNTKFPPNVIKNQKYNIITFMPLVLFQQFKFFLNLYFLVMACSQFFPDVRIGYWYTYWGPLIFVLMVTLIREAIDDIRRKQRDKEINGQKYYKITRHGRRYIPSSKIKVGDLVQVEKDQRVPADMVLLRTSDRNGRCFIRTDQLDGETDWKLRLPVLQPDSADLEMHDADLFPAGVSVYAERPQMDIHSFIGTLSKTVQTGPNQGDTAQEETGLNVENTLWANTVLAAGSAVGLVIYTGTETRSVMNNSIPRSKVGLIDMEINDLTKILFAAVTGLAFLMMCLKGWDGLWYCYMFRFVLLFSYIIPISLRVNMDMAKAFYAWSIQKDELVPGTVVRSTTISEDLGRISYLLTDKTGTLTQNEMIFKRLCLATSQADSTHEIKERLLHGLKDYNAHQSSDGQFGGNRISEVIRVVEAIKALAVCHNVTPVYDDQDLDDSESAFGIEKEATYQASSPDEIALVKYTKDVGLSLIRRDTNSMTLRSSEAGLSLNFQILQIFPFTSEAKRMGIIVKEENGDITFYSKGADVVMHKMVKYNDWLEEACGNMSREGLRTLVVAKRRLESHEYEEFEKKYNSAKSSKTDRAALMATVVAGIEESMDLLCVTGVEDTLQKDVKVTLETLRNAGIRIWMLTGDKLETATCIAKSSKLVATQQDIHVFKEIIDRAGAFEELNAFRRRSDSAMVIKGESLDVCLQHYEKEFMELACGSPVVVVCRCSPTQKARVVTLVQKHTGKRTAAVGDGGNDVAMIQAADAGIGIEGKEGRQASLAADFSITQFSFIAALLLVHGRYSYKRSAALAQFVMHRGLIITVMQAVFSSIFYFSSVALYQGFLMIGYATVYTMLPVFALVLDKDVKAADLLRLPELYSDLGKGRSLTYKTFFIWVLISVYQGGVIMYGALILFQDEFIHVVSISFTSLILTELIMVALTIRTMHRLMVLAEVASFLAYLASLVVFHQFFDTEFILSWNFVWKTTLITALSCVPIYVSKVIRHCVAPPSYSKLS